MTALLVALAGCVPQAEATGGGTSKTPATSSDIEPVSGIRKDSLVGIQGIGDSGGEMLYGVFYVAKTANPAELKAAPARICASRGYKLVSAEDKPLEHPEELPGVRKLMVRCK
jgi:hypothetical protein